MKDGASRTGGTKIMFWVGWVISALPILMMGAGGLYAYFKPQMMQEGLDHIGYPASVGSALIAVEVTCAILYAIPQTAALGAILLTGYLGGAIACHVRVGQSFTPAALFGVLVWLGLFLRDARVRALIPWRR